MEIGKRFLNKSLPFAVKLMSNHELTARKIQPQNFEQVYKLFEEFGLQEKGISVDEFSGKEEYMKKLQLSDNIGLYEPDNDEMVAYLQTYPSPLVRSVKPVYNTCYTVRNPKHKTLMQELLGIMMARASVDGYCGLLGRMSLANMHALSVLNYHPEGLRLGSIPLSCKVAENKFADDLIIYMPYGHNRKVFKPFDEVPFKAENMVTTDETFVISNGDIFRDKKSLADSSKVTLHIAKPEDRLAMDHLFHDCAVNGKDYGLDEFQVDGSYSRKMLRSSATVVARDERGACVGGFICGSSVLCRSPSSPLLAVYVVLHRDMRTNGLAELLYQSAIQLAQHHNLQGIITDVLTTSTDLLHAATKCGLVIVGSIPDTACVQGHGYADTAILCYKF